MMRILLLATISLVGLSTAHAAKIELVAGGGTKEPPCAAAEVQLREPFGVEFTPAGEMIIVEMAKGERVLRMDKAGQVHLVAGKGQRGYAGDGSDPQQALFNGIHNLAALPDGSLLLADTWNQRVRRIDPKFASIQPWAGTGKKGFDGDGGPATEATFGMIIQIALDPKAQHLYLADIENVRVRRIDVRTRTVETVAGNGRKGVPADGAPAKESPLVDPRAVVPDREGGFYILERSGHALRHVDGGGVPGHQQPGPRRDVPNRHVLLAQRRGPRRLLYRCQRLLLNQRGVHRQCVLPPDRRHRLRAKFRMLSGPGR